MHKTGIQERATEYGERWEQRECYIPGNAAKNCWECRQKFREMSLKIPENIRK